MDPALDRSYRALNGYFDRIFVLTLRRSTERHATIERSLAGLRYELVYGQDKADLDLADLEARGVYDDRAARRAHRYGRGVTLGHIACVLSHARIWRRMLDEGLERVLVFEDDAEPIPEAIALAPAVLEQLPPTFEFVYLGYKGRETVTPRRRLDQAAYVALGALRLIRWSAREALNLLPRPYSENLRRAGRHDHTHAYALTRSAARKLLASQQPVVLNVDTGIGRLILRGALEAYVTEPKLFRQRGDSSYILEGPSAVRR
ncbi:glycosyltransferase family 25 protein [Anaeromyxobacter terrae]|uniref:glycosyltransferase family 25 protein n=1 Tax=Anaeromyxobacter terrae TaxID=2925406 RepID=UPI001F56BB3C|nr:glycosyltransferase family 25 protein [Anaeromyxobacter sp. SG22]